MKLTASLHIRMHHSHSRCLAMGSLNTILPLGAVVIHMLPHTSVSWRNFQALRSSCEMPSVFARPARYSLASYQLFSVTITRFWQSAHQPFQIFQIPSWVCNCHNRQLAYCGNIVPQVSSAIPGHIVDVQLVRKWTKVVRLLFHLVSLASAGPRPTEILATQVSDTVP